MASSPISTMHRATALYVAPIMRHTELSTQAKYLMQNPFSNPFRPDLNRRINNDFDVGMTVAILLCGRCPEQVGDDLRQWLGRGCPSRWRQIRRGNTNAVTFEFEDEIDAGIFLLSV